MQTEMTYAGVSLQTLFHQFMPAVYRVALFYLKNPYDAEDVIQECFLRLAQCGKKFDKTSQVRAWLMVTASNVCKDCLRRKYRRDLPLEEVHSPILLQENEEGLIAEVFALPERYKTAIYLYYFEGYMIKEIAIRLHKPENTVKTWLRRGRELLREQLTNYC